MLTKGSTKMSILIALGMLANSACGMSPLLNHSLPNRSLGQETSAKFELKCRLAFPEQDLCADMDLSKAPKNSNEEGSVKIYFWNPNRNNEFQNPKVNWVFKPWMSSMGHGTGKVELTEEKPGVFVANKLSYVMGGEWDLFIVMQPSQRDPNKEPNQRNVEKITVVVGE